MYYSNDKPAQCKALNVTLYPFEIKDANGNVIYHKDSNGYWGKAEWGKNGFWWKSKYNSKDRQTYFENSEGFWWKSEYDGLNETYFENSEGYWWKREYNSEGDEIYYENSKGKIIDKRPKLLS